VTEGLEVARLFLDGGVPIVVTESKAMAAAPPLAAGPALTALPLTVLVNDHTASASEILAGGRAEAGAAVAGASAGAYAAAGPFLCGQALAGA
jgi:C-terminal processing protease CtpA/Prc